MGCHPDMFFHRHGMPLIVLCAFAMYDPANAIMPQAKNIVNYLRILHRILAPGGVWINLGVLCRHSVFLCIEIGTMVNFENI